MDANGTLKTAVIFDYESNASTYSMRVQAKDDYNATVEDNFMVMLTDDQHEDTDGDSFTDFSRRFLPVPILMISILLKDRFWIGGLVSIRW